MKKNIVVKLLNLLLLFLCVLLFSCADAAVAAAQAALKLCAGSILPSLFPFMTLSVLISHLRLLEPLGRLFPMEKLFALPAASAEAFLLGGLCGFPIGAKTACELYRTGRLSREEAERACALVNNAGPAFCVNVAGIRFWKSRKFGWYLYAAQIVSGALVCALVGLFLRRGKNRSVSRSSVPAANSVAANLVVSFTEAVAGSATACVPLCGYITFFSILCAIARELLPGWTAAICAVLELTSGIQEAATLGGRTGLFLTGFSLGFSGLSVFLQSGNFTLPLGLSLRFALAAKSAQGLICGGLCLLYPLLSGIF